MYLKADKYVGVKLMIINNNLAQMIPGNIKIGDLYTKKELSILFNDNNISIIREGIYHNKNFNSTLLFVDLNKEGKEKRFE